MCGADTSDHKILGQRLNRSQGMRPKRKRGISTTVMQCTTCSLIYSNPQPVPHDIQDHRHSARRLLAIGMFALDPSYSEAIAKKELAFSPG
jgi:hypothetical protein